MAVEQFIEDYGLKKDEEEQEYVERVDKINTLDDKTDFGDPDLYFSDLNELSKRFDKIEEKFSNSKKVQEKIDEIKGNKINFFSSFNKDFFELGKLISELKKVVVEKKDDNKEDITEKKDDNEEDAAEKQGNKEKNIEKKLTDKEKLNKLGSDALKEDYEHNKVFDKALDSDLGKLLEGWVGKEKIKELFKIPWLGGILKGFLGLEKDFKFSNNADKFLKKIEADPKIENGLEDLKDKKNGVNELIEEINKIENGKGKKIINETFNNLAKYHTGIENFNSGVTKFTNDNKNVSFEIEAKSVSENIFLRKEINGTDGSGIGSKDDIMKSITKVLKGKGDFSAKFEKVISELKNTFSIDELKKITDSDGNFKVATIDPNNPKKLNISFFSVNELKKNK